MRTSLSASRRTGECRWSTSSQALCVSCAPRFEKSCSRACFRQTKATISGTSTFLLLIRCVLEFILIAVSVSVPALNCPCALLSTSLICEIPLMDNRSRSRRGVPSSPFEQPHQACICPFQSKPRRNTASRTYHYLVPVDRAPPTCHLIQAAS